MRFIHLADVHLGAVPDAGAPWSAGRGQELYDTFASVIDDAVRLQADLLLIAGDLFHHPPTVLQLQEVNDLFGTLKNTRVVLIAGNHDYVTPDSAWTHFPWNRNVVGLFSDTCECVRFPEIDTEVYGFSYDRQEIMEPRYDALHPLDRGARGPFRILLAHGGDARHIPVSREALRRSGFDYVALGHIHKPEELLTDRAAWSGALEPIDCSDFGPHGYILGEVNGRRVHTEFIRKAKRSYRELELSCSSEDTTYALIGRLQERILAEGPEDIYRVRLVGERAVSARFDLQRLAECAMVLDVTDETIPAYRLEELKRRYDGQLIGRYIESFEGKKLSVTEETALRRGLEALLESYENT